MRENTTRKQLEQLLEQNQLAPNENIKAVPLFRNARSSNILVQVRDREPLHRHVDSDITVFLLRGEGEMRLGKETRPVRAGDVIHIERNTIHAYGNRGQEAAAALVVRRQTMQREGNRRHEEELHARYSRYA